MPPHDKTVPSMTSFNSPTTVSPSPFAAKAAKATPVQRMDLEVTVPVQGVDTLPTSPDGRSPLSEVMALIGERRPDLVEALLNIDRTYRQQAEAALKAQMTRQQQQLDELLKKVDVLVKSSREVADKAVEAGLAQQTTAIDSLLDRIDKQLNGTNTTSTRVSELLNETQHSGQEILDEAKRTNNSYKELLARVSEERDVLARELRAAREQTATETQRQTQAFADLQRLFERDKKEAREAMAQAEHRAREAESQAHEALASRDRIAIKVAEVEAKLDQVVIPLRQELETARAHEAQLKVQLEAARKEVATFRLMSPPSRGQ